MNRDIRKQVAQETLLILEKGSYSIGGKSISIKKELDHAIQNTTVFLNDLDSLPQKEFDTVFSLKNETTNEACERWSDETLPVLTSLQLKIREVVL